MKATRESFGEVLVELGEKYPEIVSLDADLSKSTKSEKFAKKFPERSFQMGIAESNMIGTAAGLALAGKIPFASSFGCFLTGRYDQIRMSVAYNRAPVKLVGTHAGIAIGEDGNSQMGLEDIGLVRALENLQIVQPMDHEEAKQAIRLCVEDPRPYYFRLTRQKLPMLTSEKDTFQLGKWKTLEKGEEVALLGTGALVHSCLEANQKWKRRFTVINASSLKPVDEKLILELAATHKWIVTAEDHYRTGGLGSAVAEVLAEEGATQARLCRVGVDDFGESGSPEALYKKYGLDGEGIARKLTELLGKTTKTASL